MYATTLAPPADVATSTRGGKRVAS
jgi:hypothetical protein